MSWKGNGMSRGRTAGAAKSCCGLVLKRRVRAARGLSRPSSDSSCVPVLVQPLLLGELWPECARVSASLVAPGEASDMPAATHELRNQRS